MSQMGFGGKRKAWKRECVSAVAFDLPWVTWQMLATSLHHFSQNDSPLRHSTSDSLNRTESVVLWGFPPNHHKEAAFMTTAALSAKLCYLAVIEDRDQRHIGNPLVPAIKLLDRDIQRFIRQKWNPYFHFEVLVFRFFREIKPLKIIVSL